MDTDGEDARKIFLIVGAGIFGASAALHIKRAKPWATVILLDQTDFPNQAGASYDHNKIIRSDYRDIFYMKLALQAMEAWRNDPLFKPFYHETGMMFAENAGKGVDWLLNYGLLGHETGATLMEVEEARELFPWFKNANWHGVKQAYYNPRDGWGNAVQALHAVLKAAIDLGVVYQKAVVERLYLEYRQGDPTCVGVHTSQGLLQADHILLCTGAATAKLMADSAPNDSSMQVSGRLVAAAALSCMVRVLPEKRHIYKGAPVFANLMNHTSGALLLPRFHIAPMIN
jgi:sarcosine oxidase/L-pipecolate oxidase